MSANPKKLLNINDFLSRVRESGFSRLSKIAIVISPPAELREILNFNNTQDYLTYFAESVTFPGLDMSLTNLNYGGPVMKMPISTDYREISATFIVDDFMRQKMFFDAWMNYINPKENKFDFRYRDDYIGEIRIYQISEAGDQFSYGVKLYEAFPISMAEIKGSWAEQEPVRLDVTFSYRYWRTLRADKFERDDSDAPEILESIEVIGTRKDAEVLESIDVIGKKRDAEVLESIDVIGNTRDKEVLESITVTGRRRSR